VTGVEKNLIQLNTQLENFVLKTAMVVGVQKKELVKIILLGMVGK